MTYGTDGENAFGDRNRKEAFASAGDTCKTLLTLTTGILCAHHFFHEQCCKVRHNE